LPGSRALLVADFRAQIAKQILQGVAYLHGKGIVHRDLKPENIMFLDETDDQIKICDFGLSRSFDSKTSDALMHTRAGTAYYMAPELLLRNYSELCDVWSVGCIVYVMLCGFPPFYAASEHLVFQQILTGALTFPSPDWDAVSASAQAFIRALLTKDPAKRPSAAATLELEWLANASDDVTVTRRALDALAKFCQASKLKRAVFAQIAETLSMEELSKLKTEFEAIDTNRDGVISAEEIAAALNRVADAKHNGELDLWAARLAAAHNAGLRLDWPVFIKAASTRREYLRKERVLEIFNNLDKDKSGRLSVKEIQSALGGDSDPKIVEEIMRLDVNKDGELDLREFEAMLRE
jgi:calcium-dependent protein kinase